jgi:predicted restriction endonuclease
MNELDNSLSIIDNNSQEIIIKDFLDNYKKYNYDDESEMELDLNILLQVKYKNIKKVEKRTELDRKYQKRFKKDLLKRYNNKCVISGNNCKDELEAAHIIPVSEHGSYNIDNGLLLSSNLHKTFDKYYWSINPKKSVIEIKEETNVGSIKKYQGYKIDIELNYNILRNLENHYNIFLKI